MKKPARDPVREDRIDNEAIVEAGPEEQAMGWFYLPEEPNPFPVRGEAHLHRRCLTAPERGKRRGNTHGGGG
jgi:hypothetical protein